MRFQSFSAEIGMICWQIIAYLCSYCAATICHEKQNVLTRKKEMNFDLEKATLT
jgi:hypothetical protein